MEQPVQSVCLTDEEMETWVEYLAQGREQGVRRAAVQCPHYVLTLGIPSLLIFSVDLETLILEFMIWFFLLFFFSFFIFLL